MKPKLAKRLFSRSQRMKAMKAHNIRWAARMRKSQPTTRETQIEKWLDQIGQSVEVDFNDDDAPCGFWLDRTAARKIIERILASQWSRNRKIATKRAKAARDG